MEPIPGLRFRTAREEDLPVIVRLLAADSLGAGRERPETPLSASYLTAFKIIDADANNELLVATLDERVIGVLQLTFIPCLTHQGSWRALIEGVRVASEHRSRGIGRELLRRAIERARERRCRLVQLTTDKTRLDAHRFYERLGFKASHEGMKLHLEVAG